MTGTVKCFDEFDCVGKEVRIVQQGLHDIPNRKTMTTTTDAAGKFSFIEMPKLKFQIQTDLMHFCWEKEKLRFTVEDKSIPE